MTSPVAEIASIQVGSSLAVLRNMYMMGPLAPYDYQMIFTNIDLETCLIHIPDII